MQVTVQTEIPRRWLTVEQAADYLNCRVRTIRELIWSGELKRAKVGKRFLIDLIDLDSLVKSRLDREIDPLKPARIAGRERGTRLKTLYSRGSQRGAVDGQSTVPAPESEGNRA
jgi:excisionase family DNA binding protein